MYVGLCSDPRQNRILDTGKIKKENFKPNIYHIRLSTASNSNGEWQFASGTNQSYLTSVIEVIPVKAITK